MSRVRLALFIGLSVLSSAWAVTALYAQWVRSEHQHLISEIRAGTTNPEQATLDVAIADYEHAMAVLPCSMALHEDRLLLVAERSDAAMASPDVIEASAALDKMQNAIAELLVCSPANGKAWLDFAMVNLFSEGFTKRSLSAYEVSGEVAPGESWLAQKRLFYALQFKHLFTQKARARALKDIDALERGHPNRIKAVMEVAKVETPEALRALFVQ